MSAEDFKLWKLVCEVCGFWKIVKRLEDYPGPEVKRSKVQAHIPKLEGGKTVAGTFSADGDSCRRFRCLGCGRLISGRQITDTPALDAERDRVKKLQEEADRR